MSNVAEKLDSLLKRVEKPGRYIGGEVNSVKKSPEDTDVNFCFCFPDIYEIGMSYLGLQILYKAVNDRNGLYCQRAFHPQEDMEMLMREEGVPLYTLETKTPLNEMDCIGFTLQYEMSFTTMLNMLDLAGLPVFSRERGEDMPLVIAGGPCAVNPEPLWEFVDCFLIGDGEEALPDFLEELGKAKKEGLSKRDFLRRACGMQGTYVPAFYDVEYNVDGTVKSYVPNVSEAPLTVRRNILPSIEDAPFPVDPIIPMVEAVHDRAVVETFRGCTRGCRFCQAGMIYRPIRERSVEKINEIALKQLRNTGHEELSLLSLSSSDYSEFEDLALGLIDMTKPMNVSLSLPSLRMDRFAFEVLEKIQEYRKSSLTYAPEAGTQRLRNIINKGVTDDDIYESVRIALSLGWNHIKLYFMDGLPGETYEDLDGIADIVRNIKSINYQTNGGKLGRFRLTVSVSNFVPKAFTPFQWESQDTPESFREKHNYLSDKLKVKGVTFNYHDDETSAFEAVFARGDRKTSRLLYSAWKLGAKLDGWSEHYRPEIWAKAFEVSGIDKDFYTTRKRDFDEVLPWDIIDCGVTKSFLRSEAEKAYRAETTGDCRIRCRGCGINRYVECEKEGILNGR